MAQDVFTYGDFTVTPSFSGSPEAVVFTLTDPSNLFTRSKMIRSVIGDAIDQWLVTNAAQLVTNVVTLRGSDGFQESGDGFQDFDWNFEAKTAQTNSAIVTTGLTTTAITASPEYADVI